MTRGVHGEILSWYLIRVLPTTCATTFPFKAQLKSFKNFAIFTGKRLFWSGPATFLKREFNISTHFEEHLRMTGSVYFVLLFRLRYLR